MNIRLNAFCRFTILHIKEKVIPVLTDQEKKILVIVSLAFGFLAACLIAKRFCFKKVQSSEILENNQKTDSKIKEVWNSSSPIQLQKGEEELEEIFDEDEANDLENSLENQSETEHEEDLQQEPEPQNSLISPVIPPQKTPTDSSSVSDAIPVDHMKIIWKKVPENSWLTPYFFKHDGVQYALWKSGQTAFFQSAKNWGTGGDFGRLSFSINDDFSVKEQRFNFSIEVTLQHLLDALIACAEQLVSKCDKSAEQDLKADNLAPHSSSKSTKAVYPIDYGLFKPEDLQEIKTIRKPLVDILSNYFDLDEYGYIFGPKSTLSPQEIEENFEKKERAIAEAFYKVSKRGDAAYADDIRTTLAGFNIASSPVDKDAQHIEGKTHDEHGTRPVSYVKSKSKAAGKKEPGIYKSKQASPAYIDMWGNAIWKGYKDYRFITKNKTFEQEISVQQIMDYLNRHHRILALHQEGLLLGRVANVAEARDFISHRYQMGNDILSTTLWPKEHDPLIMQLFSEYGTDTVGLLLDHTRAGDEDFGVSFQTNAVTVGQGFQNHKVRRKGKGGGHLGIEGAHSIQAQKELLEAFSTEVREGGAVSNLNISLSSDGSHYQVKKVDARAGGASKKEKKIFWNEQTFYRGIEKDLFTGLFVKSDSDSFSKELKALFELQDRIRRRRGVYVPIFQFKGSTNELEEIVPDTLLLSVTGTKNVTPINGRTSRFSQELQGAGITQEMALKMSDSIAGQGDVFKSLFELQLLMFNMKDVMGTMTVPVKQMHGGVLFEPIRILDNLHLVFPTIFKTKNPEAKQPDSHFTKLDLQTILTTPELLNYLRLTLSHNLSRFLGVKIKGSTVTFDSMNADLFTQQDVKKSDFAKVLSRALQSAILFHIYGDETIQTVRDITAQIRKKWPDIGITPGGIDMILGSTEMQTILQAYGLNALTYRIEPVKSPNAGTVPIPQFPYQINAIDPFSLVKLPTLSQVKEFLAKLGIKNDGAIDPLIFVQFKDSDPHLLAYETAFLQAIQMLYIINKASLAKIIMSNVRNECPEFGFAASREDLSSPKSDLLMRWLQETLDGRPHEAEFPFQSEKTQQVKAPTFQPRGRFALGQDEDEEESYGGRSRFARQHLKTPTGLGTHSLSNEPKLNAQELQKQVAERKLIPPFSPDQIRVGTALGLIDVFTDKALWSVVPSFHGGDSGKPTKPYIAIRDLLGHYAPHLMTGPAFEDAILKKDRDSFQLTVNPKIVPLDQIERLVTHTLAMTTEGDKQVLRPNGLQYSQSITPPMGGNIEFNGGNEKHRFRSNDPRKFHKKTYSGMGAYSNEDLKAVEELDTYLLSDQERRIKRAGLLASGYVTVTAEGGFGSERKPLDRGYRVLYLATAGAQFEKYGRGLFVYQNGSVDENELEASDFIIKKGKAAQLHPIFPHYYPEGTIPAHTIISSKQNARLGDGDFTKPYVELMDGAFFYREAFQNANDDYYLNLVIPTLNERTDNKPYYLKATLAGGGFFAQTDQAGNLRSEVIHATLQSYIKAIDQGLFPAGSVIEFPRYGEEKAMPKGLMQQLKEAADQAGIELVWTPEGDVCDFKAQTALSGKIIDLSHFEKEGCLVVLGAADAMSWHGNEPSSSSVESCFANNSNLRIVMNWWANPRVLEVIKGIVG